MNVSTVLAHLSKIAPTERALSYDNVGLLVGNLSAPVNAVCIALDVTDTVIDEAVSTGADLIVSHHPVIFTPLKRLDPTDATGALLYKLVQNGISVISMHTNLDAADNGVNTVLADRVGLGERKVVEVLGTDGDRPYGIGLYGSLPTSVPLHDFMTHIKSSLDCPALRYADGGRPVRCVAVGGGSCGDFVTLAPSLGIDTLITADVKHSHFIAAKSLGINLIDAGHFHTENPVTDLLYHTLSEEFPELPVRIAKQNLPPYAFF